MHIHTVDGPPLRNDAPKGTDGSQALSVKGKPEAKATRCMIPSYDILEKAKPRGGEQNCGGGGGLDYRGAGQENLGELCICHNSQD